MEVTLLDSTKHENRDLILNHTVINAKKYFNEVDNGRHFLLQNIVEAFYFEREYSGMSIQTCVANAWNIIDLLIEQNGQPKVTRAEIKHLFED
ncbi:hypothetical protein PAF15_06610 [Weissella koreensis]|uniref:hypothetical protein n=1 Tax=Weissella koreensis TaxID=165096 RepID=UPI0022BA3BC2|nr:hypothetical protein [Weissella koreensis]MCZ9311610.1 hypothetical protein [Weissella koreensis]